MSLGRCFCVDAKLIVPSTLRTNRRIVNHPIFAASSTRNGPFCCNPSPRLILYKTTQDCGLRRNLWNPPKRRGSRQPKAFAALRDHGISNEPSFPAPTDSIRPRPDNPTDRSIETTARNKQKEETTRWRNQVLVWRKTLSLMDGLVLLL